MEQLREASLDLLVELARPTSHDSVLDYACGAGVAGFALAPEVRSVEAVDELPDTLEEGRRLAGELGLVNVAFALVDLYRLPYPDATFSLVVCHNAFHLLPEPVAALVELTRVTTAGGGVVVLDAVVDDATDRAFNEVARLREPSHRRFYVAEELEGLVEQAGLRIAKRGSLRRTVDLDYWLQAAAVPAPKAELIRDRFRELAVDVQADMDIAFADRLVSFSYDVVGLRLER